MLEKGELIGIFIIVVVAILFNYTCLKSYVKRLCIKSSNLRKYLPYFKKNFFKKLFLVGTNGLFSKGEIVANYIFIITPESVDISGDFLNLVDSFDKTGF